MASYLPQRRADLKRRYGITLKQYDEMYKAQKGRCLLCRHQPKRTLGVDHHHGSGRVRGLLCDACNRLIVPKAERDPGFLDRLREYVAIMPQPSKLPPSVKQSIPLEMREFAIMLLAEAELKFWRKTCF
jgi:hypothetical protein